MKIILKININNKIESEKKYERKEKFNYLF